MKRCARCGYRDTRNRTGKAHNADGCEKRMKHQPYRQHWRDRWAEMFGVRAHV